MKPFLSVLLLGSLIACSPYKKIVLSASERLTKDWKGAPEANVHASYGVYKKKTSTSDGYQMLFDYSYAASAAFKKPGNYQIKASNQHESLMTPPAADPYRNPGDPKDSVIKRIVFYFDKSQHVQYVEATGFPDSVYYVKRK